MSNFSAIVAGGSSGIGNALLEELSQKYDWNLYSFDITEPKIEIPKVKYLKVDVTDSDSISSGLDAVEGHLELIVNSAGVKDEETPEGIKRMFKVNVQGTANLLTVIGLYLENQAVSSTFVQVSSAMALSLDPNFLGYSLSKLGGTMVAESFKNSPYFNNRIKIVYPGPVDTPLFRKGKTNESIQRIQPTKPKIIAEKIMDLVRSSKDILRCLDDFPNWTYILE
ncbi:MAG: SDR family oxidoreductase [Nanoarchaeota archaeon]